MLKPEFDPQPIASPTVNLSLHNSACLLCSGLYFLQIHMLRSQSLIPQNLTIFRDGP